MVVVVVVALVAAVVVTVVVYQPVFQNNSGTSRRPLHGQLLLSRKGEPVGLCRSGVSGWSQCNQAGAAAAATTTAGIVSERRRLPSRGLSSVHVAMVDPRSSGGGANLGTGSALGASPALGRARLGEGSSHLGPIQCVAMAPFLVEGGWHHGKACCQGEGQGGC